MRKIFLSICLSISLVPLSFAVRPNAAPAASKAKPSENPAPADARNKPSDAPSPVSAKNKSSFQFDAGSRSPFWPIGWKPSAQVSSASGTDQGAVPPGSFLVTTITLDGATHFAIINGKTMSEGQQFGLQIGTQIYQVTVKRIEDGRVILGRPSQEIIVPLRRK